MTVAMPENHVEICTHTGSFSWTKLSDINVSKCVRCLYIYYCYVAITVMFSETTYNVNEGDGSAQIGLVLSGPSSTATTVRVSNTDGSATGKYYSILINY